MIFCLPSFCFFDSQPIMLGESACISSLIDYYDDLKNIMKKFKAPSTLIRFQTKTELFCSGYDYRPHYDVANDHRKRSHSKTLSRVERFENDAFENAVF